MKILVLSDSHGRDNTLTDIIYENKDVNTIIYLGDGERDLDVAVRATGFINGVIQVRGNCDRASMAPVKRVVEFGGVRMYITHGAEEHVKLGFWNLLDSAKKDNCTLALFGHTHVQRLEEKDGVALFNPGSAANGDYGLIMINNGKAIFEHKKTENIT